MSASPKSSSTLGRFAYQGLDRVLHERARLSILTSLIGHKGGLPFAELKRLCSLSDGNLSRHLQVLTEAKVVVVTKSFEKNRPQTQCQITALGRKRFLDYLQVLEQVVLDAAGETSPARAARAGFGLKPA